MRPHVGIAAALLCLASSCAHDRFVTPTLSPLRPEIVLGEPTFVLLAVKKDSPRSLVIPGGVVSGVWQRKRVDGSWEDCWTEPLLRAAAPSRESFRTSGEFRAGESRVLGVVSPGACETIQRDNFGRRRSIPPPWSYEVRFNGDSGCCRASEVLDVRVISGSPADVRARTAERQRTEHTDSILAGWDFLWWGGKIDRLYEDPVSSLESCSYLSLVGDELLPGVEQMQAFLGNFQKFPFAQTIRLRLATELAILGRIDEATAELGTISGTPQEPHVREDARKLQAALEKASGRRPCPPVPIWPASSP